MRRTFPRPTLDTLRLARRLLAAHALLARRPGRALRHRGQAASPGPRRRARHGRDPAVAAGPAPGAGRDHPRRGRAPLRAGRAAQLPQDRAHRGAADPARRLHHARRPRPRALHRQGREPAPPGARPLPAAPGLWRPPGARAARPLRGARDGIRVRRAAARVAPHRQAPAALQPARHARLELPLRQAHHRPVPAHLRHAEPARRRRPLRRALPPRELRATPRRPAERRSTRCAPACACPTRRRARARLPAPRHRRLPRPLPRHAERRVQRGRRPGEPGAAGRRPRARPRARPPSGGARRRARLRAGRPPAVVARDARAGAAHDRPAARPPAAPGRCCSTPPASPAGSPSTAWPRAASSTSARCGPASFTAGRPRPRGRLYAAARRRRRCRPTRSTRSCWSSSWLRRHREAANVVNLPAPDASQALREAAARELVKRLPLCAGTAATDGPAVPAGQAALPLDGPPPRGRAPTASRAPACVWLPASPDGASTRARLRGRRLDTNVCSPYAARHAPSRATRELAKRGPRSSRPHHRRLASADARAQGLVWHDAALARRTRPATLVYRHRLVERRRARRPALRQRRRRRPGLRPLLRRPQRRWFLERAL